ncbi:undecaprenyl/decaprenyl-phosphate alpha-N-acetylglucosaminyl 1-phosphate transferase [bacterium]|nr:undecaprenyl/decaprenyl-phosphate alpha-N-acetylglucosaminyl 1-phosphate transferase [bacterium]MBU3955165.1 undecaprenyl/decaprenyl-phosphate alpha-N-acetylglucosaminyl 1-phosphate transferase [bacterium]MBU4134101.1 undecaprenyl/decaprenyl-phosphate alpha-N-acetylglucosaminyl 1-phosphate transferase [bacterium]
MIYYIITLIVSFAVTAALVPSCMRLARKFNIIDFPNTAVKTHFSAMPYLGGVAIFAGIILSLSLIRFISNFPTGTLYTLRGIFLGSGIIFLLGLSDDVSPLDYKLKFFIQMIAASVLFKYGISIKLFTQPLLNYFFSMLWILAITNSFNIIDVMDGLSATSLMMCSLFFFMVSFPSEQIYVNFASLAAFGAAAGFLVYNFPPARIFMGDTGSLTLGFIMAAVSLGAEYSTVHPIGVFAPLIILAIPLFDVIFVMMHRARRGLSPFRGSKDHFALRMLNLGFTREQILFRVAVTGAVMGTGAWLLTIVPMTWAFVLCGAGLCAGIYLAGWLSVIDVEDF